MKKNISANFSNFSAWFWFLVLIETKDNTVDVIKNKAAIPVISSNKFFSPILDIFNDVRTIKQNPSKFVDEDKICSDLLFIIINIFFTKIEKSNRISMKAINYFQKK